MTAPEHRDCEHKGKPYAVGCFDCLDSMWLTVSDLLRALSAKEEECEKLKRERDAYKAALDFARRFIASSLSAGANFRGNDAPKAMAALEEIAAKTSAEP